MKLQKIFIFALTCLLVSCSKKADNQYTTHTIAARADSVIQIDEYTIYSVILDSLYADPYEIKARVSSAMLIDSTIPMSRIFKSRNWRDNFFNVKDQLTDFALDSLFSYFNSVNVQSTILSSNEIRCRLNLVIISASRLDSLFGGTLGSIVRWDLFYKVYPHTRGLAHFSRVAFNSAHDQAVIYWEREREPLMGYGEFVFLVKKNGTWRIVEKVLTWIS